MVIDTLPHDAQTRLDAVWEALADVPDPEIPSVSVIELGIVHSVEFVGDERLRVEIMPTFVGCPAVDAMRVAIAERLASHAAAGVDVSVTFEEPWTSDRITADGRRKLAESGFAPPAMRAPSPVGSELLQVLPSFELPVAECPYCGSTRTTLENAFGPTLCRAIYHCAECRQPFEQFKTV